MLHNRLSDRYTGKHRDTKPPKLRRANKLKGAPLRYKHRGLYSIKLQKPAASIVLSGRLSAPIRKANAKAMPEDLQREFFLPVNTATHDGSALSHT